MTKLIREQQLKAYREGEQRPITLAKSAEQENQNGR